MKLYTFIFALFGLIALSVGFIYYISVNTIFQSEPLISISDVSATYDKPVNFSLLDSTKTINLSDVIIVKNANELEDFGKGSDIISVWSKAPLILSRDNPEAEIGIDTSNILSQFGIEVTGEDAVYLSESGIVKNCEGMNFNISIDEKNLLADVNLNAQIELTSYFDPQSLSLIAACKEYSKNRSKITSEIAATFGISENVLTSLAGVALDETGEFYWTILDKQLLRDFLTDFKKGYDTSFNSGSFEDLGSFIALYTLPEKGRSMNVEVSLHFVEQWMNSDMDRPIQIAYVDIEPPVYRMGKPVYDFSNRIASGQTRIDLIRDGQGNDAVYFAELGLEEIQKIVISPGQEFSYLKQISKQPGLNRTASGRLIGNGYCNSTTTIFRAALEAGFPITDRANHAQNIASYDWGYPINAVDATFYATPGLEIDLKFKNDLSYPVMLVYEKKQDSNGFQYHYVHILTSSSAPKREVELHDWRKWDEYSPTQFKAEFRRKVIENANIIREDSFYSQYFY